MWEGERDFISQNDSVVLFFLDIAKDVLDKVYDLFLRRMDLFFQWGKIGAVPGFTSLWLLKKSYIFYKILRIALFTLIPKLIL